MPQQPHHLGAEPRQGLLDQRAQLKQETIDLMVLRGYCYLNLKMYGDATRVFEAAAATGSKDANRGLANVREATHPDGRY